MHNDTVDNQYDIYNSEIMVIGNKTRQKNEKLKYDKVYLLDIMSDDFQG